MISVEQMFYMNNDQFKISYITGGYDTWASIKRIRTKRWKPQCFRYKSSSEKAPS
jgi:hypothetical protein